eukprot:CAMPEP_0182591018 /NCGR_PEP_ID=MMETSP1324-20130603/72908_1 /TAXON_ID=236786 /ORGANISM="Florenciella sp., Strain RCC1587" /LENGTH=246 /DNA_ID=CAMNT_0024808283 /DNA_START=52 /DNA_END=789 /DNA_ORIENTATION=-
MADMIDKAIGLVNIVHIGSAAALGYLVDYRIFVCMTSWVHYCKYIYQYYWRTARTLPKYAAWKRDVLLFKTIALLNLAYIYGSPYFTKMVPIYETAVEPEMDYIGLGMVVVGYFVSISATQALGVNGTYFGIELGFVKADYCFVNGFPYNVIPHPMILSQIFALCGVFKAAHVEAWRWVLVPHVVLYLTHMTQEIYDFHNGTPWYVKAKQEEEKKSKWSPPPWSGGGQRASADKAARGRNPSLPPR